MAHNKGGPQKAPFENPQLEKDAKELERESRHQAEGSERRDVTDDEAGISGILEKGVGDESSVERRDAPPLSDNS
ncbi:MAG TPA: hypothetical protein VF794_38345 [Archangium sp.]|jgi:hypothetical protein|uniref:hypothetical protein n=1 Tax=Archangium sp. TaxID=1872627 RepID=UPI002ED7DB1E